MTAADRPTVTDNARDVEPLAWCPGCGDCILARVVRERGVCSECWGTRDDPWAAARAETTTATVEDTARAIAAWALDFAGLGVGIYLNGETIGDPHGPWDVPTDAADSLAAWLNARGLLATARTRPTREHLAEAIMDSDTIPCDVCDDSRCHYCRADAYRKADAVLALLADQPDPADVWDEAVEKIREQHPACEDPCEMCAEMDDWLTALADNPYRAGGA